MLAAIDNVNTPPIRIVKMADDETSLKLMDGTISSFRHDKFVIPT
jgi:hypothetical protein